VLREAAGPGAQHLEARPADRRGADLPVADPWDARPWGDGLPGPEHCALGAWDGALPAGTADVRRPAGRDAAFGRWAVRAPASQYDCRVRLLAVARMRLLAGASEHWPKSEAEPNRPDGDRSAARSCAAPREAARLPEPGLPEPLRRPAAEIGERRTELPPAAGPRGPRVGEHWGPAEPRKPWHRWALASPLQEPRVPLAAVLQRRRRGVASPPSRE